MTEDAAGSIPVVVGEDLWMKIHRANPETDKLPDQALFLERLCLR